MSVICSDSEDSTDENQVAIQYTAYLLGGTGPTPCFLPSSPKAPITSPKFRRSATTPSTPTKRQLPQNSRTKADISAEKDDESTEAKPAETDQHGAAGVISRQWHDPHDGQSAADSKPIIPEVCVNSMAQASSSFSFHQIRTTDFAPVNETSLSNGSNVQNNAPSLIHKPPEITKGNMREPSPSRETQSRTIHTPTASPSNTPRKTQYYAAAVSPSLSQKSPRKRRKKPKNPLPPYGPLMRDTPDDDIGTYSSDEADAIRSKGSMMLHNLRQAQLEHQWSKMEEIERWRKSANDGL